MAKGWSKNNRCPICGRAGWGDGDEKCRGFEHRDGGAVFCERPEAFCANVSPGYEKTDIEIAPFGVALFCYRRILDSSS